MVAGGLPEPDENHVEREVGFALEMLDVIHEYRNKNNISLNYVSGLIRAAVAGVIGKKKFYL